MRLLFLVERVSRICVSSHTTTTHKHKYTIDVATEKKVNIFWLSKLYRTHNTPHPYLTKLPQSSRVQKKETHTHTPCTSYTESSTTQKVAIYNFQTFFKLFLRNLQNDVYCISKQPIPVLCNVEKCYGSIMIFYKANNIRALYNTLGTQYSFLQLRK